LGAYRIPRRPALSSHLINASDLSRVRDLGLTIVFKGNKVYVTGVLVVKVEILAKGIRSPAIFWSDK